MSCREEKERDMNGIATGLLVLIIAVIVGAIAGYIARKKK